jgi:outer membrane receptor for ferrienterochelin and colicins
MAQASSRSPIPEPTVTSRPLLPVLLILLCAAALPRLAAAQQPADSAPPDTVARARARLDPLVVTAARRPTRASDAAAAVRVVEAAEIARRAGPDLTYVLRDIPGVQIDPVVGSGAGVMLQGLGSDRVLVLLDGAPLVGRLGGEFDLTRLDPALFRRLEIVEGPQSTLYGSSALGGVVNLITRTDLRSRIELGSTLGSGDQRDGRLRLSRPLGAWGTSLDLGRRRVLVPPGRPGGTAGFAKRFDAMARTLRAFGPAALDVRVLGVQENQQYSSGASSVSLNDNWQLDGLAQLTLGQDGGTEVRLHASTYDHRFATGPGGAPGAPDWDRQRVVDLEGLRRGRQGAVRWLAGAKAEHEWIVADRVASGARRGGWTGAAYGEADLSVTSALRLSTGARMTASQAWGVDLSPRLAATVGGADGPYAKLAVARGFRAPSFKELYTDFLNTRAFYAVRGSADLRPESSWNATGEVGLAGPVLSLYARGFLNQLRDFIETVRTGDSARIALFEYRNVARARTAGTEVGASVTRGVLEASASYAYLDARDLQTGDALAGRARHSARGWVAVSPGPVRLRADVVRAGRVLVRRGGTGPVYQAAATRLNASAGADLAGGFRLLVGVDNLADQVPDNALTPLGRRWYAGLTWGGGW